ncbi:MAG: 1,6-anhydro-N-acetylmuramyl-L-alanine amidase AmpD [Methylococcales symbiont of Iophon sp. n. MRB-2018]|nr:MAG: 1,6-anhydro-N-acetylmuramyl-L-alanine amidase AmpD [Methylococcales symbiont of Iophon sp. n. MRB-2018]KAF3979982.1 MAG: 1,6-anhydro-N-acetylmuramyl-L-alanine amidase AmpD [Methylococcales symbiont of Iophon sp. n. MRB-2018]
MQIDKHWLLNINKVATENFDQRPIEEDISLIVIHCISLPPEQFGNDFIDQLFCNQLTPQQHPYFEEIYQLKVSAHILIKRSGKITQYVAFNQRAWHAGVSEYKGRNACNDFSIGIELEGFETKQYTEQQYMQLSALISLLINHYPKLSVDNIVGHSDIAGGRKTDPGESFDWQKLNSALASI